MYNGDYILKQVLGDLSTGEEPTYTLPREADKILLQVYPGLGLYQIHGLKGLEALETLHMFQRYLSKNYKTPTFMTKAVWSFLSKLVSLSTNNPHRTWYVHGYWKYEGKKELFDPTLYEDYYDEKTTYIHLHYKYLNKHKTYQVPPLLHTIANTLLPYSGLYMFTQTRTNTLELFLEEVSFHLDNKGHEYLYPEVVALRKFLNRVDFSELSEGVCEIYDKVQTPHNG